jgi:CRISPR-associated protein Cst1
MKYTLTGNFQYDLGIYGLKKVLDFFEEEYQTDGKYYIEIDKKPEEILELVILNLVSQKSLSYFLNKLVDTISKSDKNLEKRLKQKLKEINFSDDKDLENFVKFVKKEKSLEKTVDYISEKIYNFLTNKMQIEKSISLQEVKDTIWFKSGDLLNNILLNFQADKSVKGRKSFEKAVKKLYENVDEKTVCSFCEENPGKRITRDVFFFGPSQYNAFWFNEPSIFICPYCLASNLAITQSLIFLGNELNAIVAYRPNLEDLESLNSGLDVKNIGEFTQKIIEYEKLSLKKESVIKEIQIIEFFMDSQNPNLEFYLLTDSIIENLLKITSQLEKLYSDDYKKSLWGQVKDKKIDISKELLKCITQNQKLILLVQRYAKLGLMAESFEQKNVKNPPIKGFKIYVLLKILEMHFILEGIGMNSFEAFKSYGQYLRGKIVSQLSEGKDVNWNTFNNKIISLANSFLDASKGSFQQFMETLTRVIITYDAPIDAEMLNMINKNTYKEISTTIALSLMTNSTKKPVKEEQQKTVEENSL